MVTISENVSNEIVIKNSKFICFLYKTLNIDEINSILSDTRGKYKDATHVCYAYVLENSKKAFDDGEPGGTAGAPILDVLEKNSICNCLAIVVRYFGGIKLGAGGLIRAYSKSVRETLALTTLEEIIFYNYYELISSYDDLKLLNNLSYGLDIVSKDFGENIVYKIKISTDDSNTIESFKNTNIKIKKL